MCAHPRLTVDGKLGADLRGAVFAGSFQDIDLTGAILSDDWIED